MFLCFCRKLSLLNRSTDPFLTVSCLVYLESRGCTLVWVYSVCCVKLMYHGSCVLLQSLIMSYYSFPKNKALKILFFSILRENSYKGFISLSYWWAGWLAPCLVLCYKKSYFLPPTPVLRPSSYSRCSRWCWGQFGLLHLGKTLLCLCYTFY